MNDFTAVFAATLAVMIVIAAMFLTALRKAMEIEKRLK